MRTLARALLLVLLLGATLAQYDDEYGGGDDYGGGGGGDEYGGGGGGEDPPPPPGGSATELLTVEDFETFLNDDDASVIGAFTAKEVVDPSAVQPDVWDEEEDGPWEAPVIENPAFTTLNEIAGSAYNYRFAYTFAPEVMAKIKLTKGGLVLYKSPRFASVEHGDRLRERYASDKLAESGVVSWLKTKSQPLVGKYTYASKERYAGPTLVIFMNLDFEKNDKSIKYVLKRARKVAATFKGKLAFAVAALSDMSYTLGDYGLESTKPNTDVLMGIVSGDDHYGAPDSKFTGETLSTFANSYLAGELTPYVKPPPEETEPDESDEEAGDMGSESEDKDEP